MEWCSVTLEGGCILCADKFGLTLAQRSLCSSQQKPGVSSLYWKTLAWPWSVLPLGLAGLFVVRLCWLPGELSVEDWRSCRGFRGGGYPICKAWLDVSSIQWSLWNSLCLVLSVSRPWSLQQGYRWLEELLSVWLHLIMWNNLKPECFIEISWSIDNIWDYQVWKRAEMCDIW